MDEIKITKLWEDFEHARAYQNSLELTTQIPVNVDFYEGRQWAAKTEATRHIPRPVVNIVKFITRSKKSSIVGAPISLVFTSNGNPEMARKLTEFNKTIENEMEMDELRNKLVQEGIVKGTGVLHYYWDSEAKGELGDFEGGVRAEIIDPLNVFFANPQEQDEQKQKWIILATRVEVNAAREMMSRKYRKNGGEKLVQPDGASALYTDEVEQDGTELVTVLTRYYRKNGEVYYERGTKSTMLHDGIAMTPPTEADVEAEMQREASAIAMPLPQPNPMGMSGQASGMQMPGNPMPMPMSPMPKLGMEATAENPTKIDDIKHDTASGENMDDGEDKLQDIPQETLNTARRKFNLYPIVVYPYETREKSIYGIGEVEGIIPNQKAINFIFAMQLLSIQNLAWGKWIVKEGALRNQKLTNAPGQVVIDHTPYGVKGIGRSDEPPISNHPMSFMDALLSSTRLVTGSTEVMTGETFSGQSGQAIANLQAQALKPIQELRDRYLRVNKKGARIVKQFYELFYDDKHFEYQTEDGQYQEQSFSGAEMNNSVFDVSIEAGAGTPYSESLEISLLTEYLGAGYIDYPTYLELLPAQIASFKTSLLKKVQEGTANQVKAAQEQVAALQEQLNQSTTALQQMGQRLEAQGVAVEKVNEIINRNRAISRTLAELYTEASNKINSANAALKAQNQEYANVRRDAQQMAMMMAEDDRANMQAAEEEAQALAAMTEQ